ncbi:hypothetical protein QQS21_011663, partial [Conoideocrella luteorostrata]
GSRKAASRQKRRGAGAQGGHQQRQHRRQKSVLIEDRPFCTQQCLLGLARGSPVDAECPKAYYHGSSHLSLVEFRRLLRAQLAVDRGREPDCTCLYMAGACGVLFKVRLSSRGYTLVAKGMEALYRAIMQHENMVYDRLQPLQGKHVPVCLGFLDLVLPYHFNGGVYTYFLLLSWAGQKLPTATDPATRTKLLQEATAAVQEIHRLRVLHRDLEPRNVLYDASQISVMVIDFERSSVYLLRLEWHLRK